MSTAGDNEWRSVALRGLPDGPAFVWVQALAVDRIGKTVAASTMDNRVQVWDMFERELVAELTLSNLSMNGSLSASGGVVALWLSPDGRWCLAVSSDRTLNLWRVGDDRPSAIYTVDKPPTWVGATKTCSVIAVRDEAGGLYTFHPLGVSLDITVPTLAEPLPEGSESD